MILKSLFFIFFISPAYGAASSKCPRPTDLSDLKALKKLEACSKQNTAITQKNKDPRQDCMITINGFYRCTSQPVRFVEKTAVIQPSIPKTEEGGGETNSAPAKLKSTEPSTEGAPSTSPVPIPAPPLPPNPNK